MADPIIQMDVNDVLGDDPTSEEVEQSTQEDSSTDEQQTAQPKSKKSAKVDPEDLPDMSQEKEEEDVLGPATEEDETDESQDDETQEPAKNGEARKAQLNTEIRQLVAQRNQLREETQARNSEAYRTQSEQELVNSGLDETDAKLEAQNQQIQLMQFNNHVSDLNLNLNTESLQLMADYPQFDPGTAENPNPEFDKALWERATALYEKVANVQLDPNTGMIVRADVLPYEFYKAFAETASSSGQNNRVQGRLEGQKAAEKNLAAAETLSSTAPKAPKTDPFLEGLLGKYKK